MAITKSQSAQCIDIQYVDFDFDTLTSGVAENAIALPAGAVVTGGAVVVFTAFNSATSDAIAVGDANSATVFASAVNAQSAARTAFSATTRYYPTGGYIRVRWTGAGTAPTAGSARVEVQYYIKNRAEYPIEAR